MMVLRRVLAGLCLCGASACASRDTPVAYPANAPSSPQAHEARLPDVTLALSGEPPMPGPQSAGWSGLAAQDEASGEPEHQHAMPSAPAAPAGVDHSQHQGHHHGAH